MGACTSKTSPNPPSAWTRTVTQHPQSNGESTELQQRPSPPVPPPQICDPTPVSAKPIQPVQTHGSIPARVPPQFDGKPSPKPPPRSSRLNDAPVLRRAASAPTYDSARITGLPASEGESSRERLPEFERSNPSSSSHRLYRSFSMDSPGSASLPLFGDRRQRDKNAISTVPDPRAGPSAATRGHNTGSFVSTVRELLPDDFRFRILVLGKRYSGKSTLINAVFNVDIMAAVPGSRHGDADINFGFNPNNNRYLVIHEYPGFDRGAQSLQTIGAFILSHTDASCSVSERLHAIWICVGMSDATERGLGEGVKDILDMKKVPVLIVFTKFDALVSRIQSDITGIQRHRQANIIQWLRRAEDIPRPETASTRAHAVYEASCRSLFQKDPKGVPAAIFSNKREYRYLIDELTSTTRGFFKANSHKSTGSPSSSQAQQPVLPIAPALLAWSIAQRVNPEIIIQACIEVGQRRYWRGLGSSRDFTNHTTESCVNVIREDIINVWNFDDSERYLFSRDFAARMSQLVGDMVGSSDVSPRNSPDLYLSRDIVPMAEWMNDLYQNNHSNIRCIMAYIVDLMDILHRHFLSTRSVSAREVQSAVKDYAQSSTRARIHKDIRSFVTQTPLTSQDVDVMLKKTIDLINQNCMRTSSKY